MRTTGCGRRYRCSIHALPRPGDAIESCALFCIAASVASSSKELYRLLSRCLAATDRCLTPGEALRMAIAYLSHGAQLVLHVPDYTELTMPFRQQLLALAELETGLLVIFSTDDHATPAQIMRGIRHSQIHLAPCDKSRLHERLGDRFGIPRELATLLWNKVGADWFQAALIVHRMIHAEILVPANDGGWTLASSLESVRSRMEIFETDYWVKIQQACAEMPKLREFLELAALCGEIVPATQLAEHLELDEQETDELFDLIDEELCQESDWPIFKGMEYRHPAFPETITYAFFDPALPQLILRPMPETDVHRRAIQLLTRFEHSLPASTRAVARIHLSLLRHLRDSDERRRWETRLAWWVTAAEADALRETLVDQLAKGEIRPQVLEHARVWSRDRWPSYRRLALLDAWASQPDGLPLDQIRPYLHDRASILYDLGRYVEALEIAEQALQMCADQTSLETGTICDLLGITHEALGELQEAEPLLRQALEIRRTALGEEHPSFATSLNNLGALYCLTGRYAEAEPLLRQAMEIRCTALGEEHPEFATNLNNLAELYRSTGRYAEAEPLLRQALEITRTALGEEHPSFATSLANLAGLYESTGRYAEAEPLLRQAMEIIRTALGEEHPDFATSLHKLAGLYQSTGRYAEAERLFRQAMEITRTALGEEHPGFAASLNNLACLYQLTGRYVDAKSLCRQAMEITRKALGEEHPSFATSLANLAELYRSTGRYAEAEPLLRQAMEITREALGEEHPGTRAVAENYALLVEKMRSPGQTSRETTAQE